MQIKEIEIGGVYNLDNYENIRIALRATISENELGEAIHQLSDITEKIVDIVRVVRRWKDIEDNIRLKIRKLIENAESRRIRAKELRDSLREEALKLMKNINIDILPNDIKKKILEDPINLFTCGLASSCISLNNIEHNELSAIELEKEANEYKKKLEEYRDIYIKMKELIKDEKIDDAYVLAKRILNFYEEIKNVKNNIY